ncbi:hypothetical protein F3Y22_tig00110403pilonHSYRG00245 [Hibiscus syriacus]|uniref:DUF4220 domain-containing protein n=1 Tax=Hibiscus syriacus TaxID=106335 RepID=A0A6A3APW8_HIBSY|nr:hypothetical protein F3Y22_tig00110403pilonHSYRG00245 [Hibiscus syriacus]
MSAGMVVNVALGILAREINGGTVPKNLIPSLWPPFLILHLGGPDTISAYSLEENELWPRKFLEIIFQFGVALYVTSKSLPDNHLRWIVGAVFLTWTKFVENGFALMRTRYLTDSGPDYKNRYKLGVAVSVSSKIFGNLKKIFSLKLSTYSIGLDIYLQILSLVTMSEKFVTPWSAPSHPKKLLNWWKLKERSDDIIHTFDVNSCKKLLNYRGDYVLDKMGCLELLKWSTIEVGFDHKLLLWHIATQLICHDDALRLKESNSLGNLDKQSKINKGLSDYMMYLLVMHPDMLPKGIGEIRYRDTCAEAIRFSDREEGQSEARAVAGIGTRSKMGHGEQTVGGKSMKEHCRIHEDKPEGTCQPFLKPLSACVFAKQKNHE